jgi:purine-binding chemotaxis protein CheW
MDQEEITSQILNQSGSPTSLATRLEGRSKFIFFRIGEVLYALPAEDVQEIMLNLPIHYLPFLPPYVRGLVNRLGEPVAVVDLQCFFGQIPLEGRAFLILKPHISKLAFLIDEVQDILSVASTDVGKLSAAFGNLNGYVRGMIRYREKDVLLLDEWAVIEAVKEAAGA